jgi:hypothetical protein
MKHTPTILFLCLSIASHSAQVRYVKPVTSGNGDGTSWANASNDIQAMMDSLKVTGGQVWVAQGTYLPLHKAADTTFEGTPTTDRYKSFVLVKDVQLYGGFIGTETLLSQRNWITNSTTLSGDIGIEGDSTDNAYHVVISAGDVGNACLDGFSITKGNDDRYTTFHYDYYFLRNTIIYISQVGCGLFIISSSLIVSNAQINENNGDGGLCCIENSFVTLSNVQVNDKGLQPLVKPNQ